MLKYISWLTSWQLFFLAIILFLIVVAVYRYFKGYTGTWNETYYYDPVLAGYRRNNEATASSKACSKGETECRRVLETIFHRKFPNVRPDFMKNPLTGRNLELDCYNDELKIACEYHGRQHYEYNRRFHTCIEDFEKQKRNDQKTRENCIKHGVFLIEVPYTVKLEDIEKFIYRKLKSSGVVSV